MNKQVLNPGLDYAQSLRNEKDIAFRFLKEYLEGRVSGILSWLGIDSICRKGELLEEEEESEPLIPVRYGFEVGDDGYSLERIEEVFVRPDGRIGFYLVGDDGRYFVCNGVWELLCVYEWVVWCVGVRCE